MFIMHPQFVPARVNGLLKSAEDAARAIPPAFPLTATVAVNPFLGQAGKDLATTAALLARVAGTRVMLPRSAYAAKLRDAEMTDADLAAALEACLDHWPAPANTSASVSGTDAATRADGAGTANADPWPPASATPTDPAPAT